MNDFPRKDRPMAAKAIRWALDNGFGPCLAWRPETCSELNHEAERSTRRVARWLERGA